jgi:phage shock protein A
MSIMTRFMRLCKADIHGVMDQLEDKGLLLKQYLRDMEEELGQKEARLRKLVVSRDKLQQDCDKYSGECEKLDQDIESALRKGKDDIARLLIKKLKPVSSEQLELRAKEYFHREERERWERTIASAIPSPPSGEPSDEEVELELLKRKEAAKGGK